MRVEQAAVKWARGREFGLEFVRILPDEEKTLHRIESLKTSNRMRVNDGMRRSGATCPPGHV
jgi:hypothetical protein